MNVDATLENPAGRTWPVAALALYTELARMPRLFAQIESDEPPGEGPFHFALWQASNETSARVMLSDSVWYCCAQQCAPAQGVYWLTLMADPGCDMQLRPFGANAQSASSLLLPRMDVGKIGWADSSERRDLKQIQTFVSHGETFEQLARRVARLTNETFQLAPGPEGMWLLHWGDRLKSLLPHAHPPVTDGVQLLAEVTHRLEPHLQQVTLPGSYHTALRQSADSQHVFSVPRPVQWGEPGNTAVAGAKPQNEDGTALRDLQANWYSVAEIASLDGLWRWRSLKPPADPAEEEAIPVSTLFLYDGQSSDSGASRAAQMFARMVGGSVPFQGSQTHGWCAYVLAVRSGDLPQDKALVERMVEQIGVRGIWERLIEAMGCGRRNLHPAPAAPWGTMLATVVNNPAGEHSDPISRSDSGLTYRTRIWIRLLGVDGDLEVDWAVPFASHDNTATGGDSGGDLILVPEENSLGYVSFVGNDGTPFFFAMTHYPDTGVSPYIDPTQYKHALVVDRGLQVREARQSVLIQARDLLTLKAFRARQKLGQDSGK